MKNISLLILSLIFLESTAQTKLFPVEIKGKSGYMDASGKVVIPANYDLAQEFSEGYAVVALRNLPCVINDRNERIIDSGLYSLIGPFSEGFAAVTDFHKKKFYVNTKGEKMITLPDEVYEARKFKEGLALISIEIDEHETKFNHDIATVGYRFGYIDKTGKRVIPLQFQDADDFDNGLARVRLNKKFGLINSKGEFILKPDFGNIGKFFERKAVIDAMGKYGFTDLEGKIVIEPKFDFCFAFSGGFAGFWNAKTNKYGFIDEKGEIKILPEYDRIKPFSEGKAAVMVNGKWGFIDGTGKMVILNIFDNAGMYEEGRCAVLVKRKWGFIDETGRLAVPADFDAAGSYENGVADIVLRGLKLYVDKQGNILPKL